jgi:hypothetical protein
MIITIFVLLLFIYPSLSLFSHKIIIVIYDLQIFLCLINKNVTCVFCTAAPETETFGTDNLRHHPSPP